MNASWRFPPSFSKAHDAVRMVSDVPDIAQSVSILLQTTPGERFLAPEYGFDWSELLFEPAGGLSNTVFNAEYLKQRLGDALAAFEPRAEITDVTISGEPTEGRVTLDLSLRVKATGGLLQVRHTVGA